jgi:hypothetical protein
MKWFVGLPRRVSEPHAHREVMRGMESLDYDESGNRTRVDALRRRGVVVWSAERVYVGPELAPEAIEPGARLMNAVIRGAETVIGRGSSIGERGSASLHDVQIGRDVVVGPGSYTGCALLDGVKVRGFAELRGGTVLEEGAEAGHTVGLKNTFFGAWVVAGSCINFCDAYVSGGTGRENHTEIGSGAMHFNFSPRRDKFGSLLGGSRGLLRRQPPIFVGGNTGLVAPLAVPFGALVPAGTTVRSWPPDAAPVAPVEAHQRKLADAAALLGALEATIAWYAEVRAPNVDAWTTAVMRGALRQLLAHRDWRRVELCRYGERVSGRSGPAEERKGQALCERLHAEPVIPPLPARFNEQYRALRIRHSHVDVIAALSQEAIQEAEEWLANIEAQVHAGNGEHSINK